MIVSVTFIILIIVDRIIVPICDIQPPTLEQLTAALAYLQHREKRFLRNVHAADAFHSLLAFFLFFQEFAFAADVSPVAFGDYVLADRGYSFAGYDLGSDCRLNRHLEHLPRNQLLHLGRQRSSTLVRKVAMDDGG